MPVNYPLLSGQAAFQQSSGRPERLSGNLSDWWSVKFNSKDRIVFRIVDNSIEFLQIGTDYRPHNSEEYVFHLRYFDEVKKLLSTFDITNLHYVASDGIGTLIKDDLNDMTKEQFSMFVDYHLSICERTDLIGYSGHILAVFEK